MDKKYGKYLTIILILAITIRFVLALLTHNAGDGCWHLSAARFMGDNFEFPLNQELGRDFFPQERIEPFWVPPIFHIFAAFLYKLGSFISNNFANQAMNLVSPIFGSLSLLIFYLIAKKLTNEKLAFYATIFLAFIPMHLYFSSLAHIDATLTFFMLLSIYLMIINKPFASAIFAGVSILTKYNGLFVLPIILSIYLINYIKTKGLKLRNTIYIPIIAIAIGSIWLIRNWILLKNPFFPHLNQLFGLSIQGGFPHPSLSYIFQFKHYISTYIAIYGVPLGDFNLLFFFDIPYINVLITLWLLGTIIFTIPLIIGFFKLRITSKTDLILMIWIGTIALLSMAYIINLKYIIPRLILPAIPALAIIWAKGLNTVLNKDKIKTITLLIITLLIISFTATEFAKVTMTRNAWKNLQPDFQWTQQNTNKDDIFYFNDQCLTYNINRPTTGYIEKVKSRNGYIWTQELISSKGTSLLPQSYPGITEASLVYNNLETTTKIYKIN